MSNRISCQCGMDTLILKGHPGDVVKCRHCGERILVPGPVTPENPELYDSKKKKLVSQELRELRVTSEMDEADTVELAPTAKDLARLNTVHDTCGTVAIKMKACGKCGKRFPNSPDICPECGGPMAMEKDIYAAPEGYARKKKKFGCLPLVLIVSSIASLTYFLCQHCI